MHFYKNGNYFIIMYNDGTKIRFNNENDFIPKFAENIDITITTKCDGGCNYCYLNCNNNGIHADLSQRFFDTLHKGQEIAINGNDLSHPELEYFLFRMKYKGVICNITINQIHFIREIEFIRYLYNSKLINGLGVSLVNSEDELFIKYINEFDNAVVHVIDGLFTIHDIEKLKNNNIKLLILGYKILGRGDTYYNNNKTYIENNISYLSDNIVEVCNYFDIVSFDNLALEHLNIESKIPKFMWDKYYMGNEGCFTFYIDAVNKTFAKSSTELVQYPILNSVDSMFKYIQEV